ncbi:MAG: exopolyphosphatase / guanosine-5-triphosphate,3-diphosphate pyrophosphatase [Thermoleophilaceae bacterium]|nr:exopolyphosphatase / guanosine-5-triphosphate,3-diphosphate pyrophosphatase [Thermoleophilaceae bacterium]
MACACIDIGSNTTRLLVAESRGGVLRELMTQRTFTRIGKSLGSARQIPAAKVAETAEVVAAQVRMAREVGAGRIEAVATAAIRKASNRGELEAAIAASSGLTLRVLSEEDEARLAFLGATRTLAAPPGGSVAVVDVGGGSTEIAIGTVEGGVDWWASLPIGSGLLCDGYLHSDPPAAAELERVRAHVSGAFEGLEAPAADAAVAVGGSATSLRRLVGAELRHDALERSIRILATTPIEEVARRFDLDPERVRLLPGGILIFDELSQRLGRSLAIAAGGIREGVIIEALAA